MSKFGGPLGRVCNNADFIIERFKNHPDHPDLCLVPDLHGTHLRQTKFCLTGFSDVFSLAPLVFALPSDWVVLYELNCS